CVHSYLVYDDAVDNAAPVYIGGSFPGTFADVSVGTELVDQGPDGACGSATRYALVFSVGADTLRLNECEGNTLGGYVLTNFASHDAVVCDSITCIGWSALRMPTP